MFLARCCLAVLLLVAARGIIWLVNFLVVAPFFDPLKWLPGPDGSAFQSHFSDLMECVFLSSPLFGLILDLSPVLPKAPTLIRIGPINTGGASGFTDIQGYVISILFLQGI